MMVRDYQIIVLFFALIFTLPADYARHSRHREIKNKLIAYGVFQHAAVILCSRVCLLLLSGL